MTKLSEDQIKVHLSKTPGWEYEDGRLHLSLAMNSFSEAFSILTQIALDAQAMNHHPDEMYIRGNDIGFELVTHSAQGITEKDFQLARKINELVHHE